MLIALASLGAGPILDRPGNNPSDVQTEQGPWASPESFNLSTAAVTGTLNGRMSIFSLYACCDTMRDPNAISAIWGMQVMQDTFMVSLPDAGSAAFSLKYPNENTWMPLPTTREPVPAWGGPSGPGWSGDTLSAEPGVAWRAMYYECALSMWGYNTGGSPPHYEGKLEFRTTHVDSTGSPVVMQGYWRTHP